MGTLPTEDLVVTSTDPTPGASVSYTVTVRGVTPGSGLVTTEMTATSVPGVTVVKTGVTVRRSSHCPSGFLALIESTPVMGPGPGSPGPGPAFTHRRLSIFARLDRRRH